LKKKRDTARGTEGLEGEMVEERQMLEKWRQTLDLEEACI
jgi:hypothetical protein